MKSSSIAWAAPDVEPMVSDSEVVATGGDKLEDAAGTEKHDKRAGL